MSDNPTNLYLVDASICRALQNTINICQQTFVGKVDADVDQLHHSRIPVPRESSTRQMLNKAAMKNRMTSIAVERSISLDPRKP